MGSLSIWHWIVVIAVVLPSFGCVKISDLMGECRTGHQGLQVKGMQDDDLKTAEKPEPVKTIDHNNTTPPTAAKIGRLRQQGRLSILRHVRPERLQRVEAYTYERSARRPAPPPPPRSRSRTGRRCRRAGESRVRRDIGPSGDRGRPRRWK